METAIQTELEQWLEGDETSFQHVFRYYYQRMLTFSLRFLKDRPEAEEVTMDVLLKVWQRRDTITNPATFKSYLFVILRNELVSLSRKKKMITVPVDPLFHELADNSQENHWALQEAVQQYEQCVSKLPPKCREVFLLSREDGLTHAEIASQMGLSIFTVKNHIKAALNVLRSELNYADVSCMLFGTILLDLIIIPSNVNIM